MNKARILIVDDEPHQRKILVEAAKLAGHEASETGTPGEAIRLARYQGLDLVITDLRMPRMNGLELIKMLRLADPSLSVVVVTAHGTIETAIDAMKSGAEDYLLKPIELPAFELVVDRILKKRSLVRENQTLLNENTYLRRELQVKYHLDTLVGKSPASRDLLIAARAAIRSREPLLILGETGTGKGDLARMIHYNSPWAARSLVFLDCGSVPAEFAPAQLFGEEIRVGTGRVSLDHPGLFERCHLGTLVLSRLEALDEPTQARIARVVTEGRCQRVGGNRSFEASVRMIVTGIEAEYKRAVDSGKIHPVLVERLGVHRIAIPPLRARPEDIQIQVLAVLKNLEAKLGKKAPQISGEVLERLSKLPLPGNVRELRERVEHALVAMKGSELEVADFFPEEKAA